MMTKVANEATEPMRPAGYLGLGSDRITTTQNRYDVLRLTTDDSANQARPTIRIASVRGYRQTSRGPPLE